ncbi:MAG: zinc-ribbon domain-containing protein [Faecousia sp.]
MNDVEYDFDRTYSLLQEIITHERNLYDILEENSLKALCISPAELLDRYRCIFNLYQTCMDSLYHLRILAEDDSIRAFEAADIEHLGYFTGRFGSILKSVENLYSELEDEIKQYELSGLSGNPADRSGLIGWIQRYCNKAPENLEINCFVLDHIKELKHQFNESRMTCVYAPPDMFGRSPFSGMVDEYDEKVSYPFNYAIAPAKESAAPGKESSSDELPFFTEVYASPDMMRKTAADEDREQQSSFMDPNETCKFCRQCGRTVPMSAKTCPYCGADFQQMSELTEPPMACVYASPHNMKKHPKGFLSKISNLFK